MIYASMSVSTLLRQHPWAEEVLEWHGVDPFEVDEHLSLGALCWLRHIDASRLARDLLSAQPDDDPLFPVDELMDPGAPADGDRDEPEELEEGDEIEPWWGDYVDYDIEQRWSA